MNDDSTQRFTDRVANYVKYRPDYPGEVVAFLRDKCGVTVDVPVADIGSGTGISSKLFLDAGYTVTGVEPNQAMREASMQWLSTHADEGRFSTVDGTAEATTLPDASIGLVTAAQAFHWFDHAVVPNEFARILQPRGLVALFWNSRLTEGTPFLTGCEALLRTWGVDYTEVSERYGDDSSMTAWFGKRFLSRATFPNAQHLDFDSLVGRVNSSSYAPKAGHPNHEPMLAALRDLFDRTQSNGKVDFLYETRLYVGYGHDSRG